MGGIWIQTSMNRTLQQALLQVPQSGLSQLGGSQARIKAAWMDKIAKMTMKRFMLML
jgi:hypothetical protein